MCANMCALQVTKSLEWANVHLQWDFITPSLSFGEDEWEAIFSLAYKETFSLLVLLKQQIYSEK